MNRRQFFKGIPALVALFGKVTEDWLDIEAQPSSVIGVMGEVAPVDYDAFDLAVSRLVKRAEVKILAMPPEQLNAQNLQYIAEHAARHRKEVGWIHHTLTYWGGAGNYSNRIKELKSLDNDSLAAAFAEARKQSYESSYDGFGDLAARFEEIGLPCPSDKEVLEELKLIRQIPEESIVPELEELFEGSYGFPAESHNFFEANGLKPEAYSGGFGFPDIASARKALLYPAQTNLLDEELDGGASVDEIPEKDMHYLSSTTTRSYFVQCYIESRDFGGEAKGRH